MTARREPPDKGHASTRRSRTSSPAEPHTSAPRLLKWEDIPHWQQDNHYILTHYRPVSNSYLLSSKSLFYLNNESVNIHTHLFGALLFIGLAFNLRAYLPQFAWTYTADVLAFGCFFVGAVLCLAISAIYHTISNHSPKVNRLGNQLDYVGIVALITGSFVPSVYYGFYCDPNLQKVYWAMISLIGIGCTIVSVTPKFRTPVWRPFRAGMFVAMGLSAVFPVLHGLKMYGFQQMNKQIGLLWVILQGMLYITGAATYAARIPERMKPGRFDVWGSSHQIFHVMVVLAAVSHFVGLLKAFEHAHTNLRCW